MQQLAERRQPHGRNTASLRQGILLLSVALVLLACSQSAGSEATAAPTAPPSTPVPSLPPEPEATATPKPTSEPSPTVWPPVFRPGFLGDIRDLSSFVVTVNEKNTVNGDLTERTITIGYIRDPLSAYNENKYSSGLDRTYVVNDRTYELTGSGDWYISAGAKSSVFEEADIPALNTEKLAEAEFAGEEEYQGIPAYHYVLQPVETVVSNTSDRLEGDFYLAIDGNYVLFSHWKETSKVEGYQQIYEVTEALSSIGQLTDIELPAAMEDMVAASDLPLDRSLPLPPDSTFSGMIRYKSGIGVDLYFFSTPKTSIDDFLNFYRNLPPTDGWTVSHVGHVRLHQDDCEFTRECVIINKGPTQVVLYYNGANIRAEFDWPHWYSPLD